MKKLIISMMSLLFGVVLLTGCSDNNSDFQEKIYSVDGGKVKAIQIDVMDRDIDISVSKDNQIHIDYYENDKEYYDISLSDENVLTMNAKTNKELSDYVGLKNKSDKRTISLQIPNDLIETLELSSSNGDVSIPELALTENLSVSINNGNIEFEKLTVGKSVNLEIKNGDISGTINGSYDDFSISCESKKGESNLPENKEGGTKNLIVSSNNGDVNIDLVKE